MNNQNLPDNPDVVVQKANKTGLFTNYIYKAIPLAFDESMSYYETLCGLLNYLQNTIIPTVNNNADAVSELQNLYIELHDYVEHYFDNLDVQEEINNKLDAMAQDGSLTLLIKNYVDPIYQAYENEINQEITSFENTINTKVDNMASGSPLVASSTSGMTDTTRVYVNTTDGKWYYYNGTNWTAGGTYQATELGDGSVHEYNLYNSILSREDVQQEITFGEINDGMINDDGTISSQATWVHYTKVDCTKGQKLKITHNMATDRYFVAFYTDDDTFISGVKPEVQQATDIVLVPNNTSYALIQGYNIVAGNLANIIKLYNIVVVVDKDDTLFEDSIDFINSLMVIADNTTIQTDATDGYYIDYSTGVATTLVGLKASDYIPLDITDNSIEINCLNDIFKSGSPDSRGLAFYDTNQTFISGIQYTNSNKIETTIPTYARYIRLTLESSKEFEIIYTNLKSLFTKEETNNEPLAKIYDSGHLTNIFNNIMCIGDSLTRGALEGYTLPPELWSNELLYSYPKQMERTLGNTVYNLGLSGATTKSWYNERGSYIENSDYASQCYIIALGTNDIGYNDSFDGNVNTDIDQSDYTQNADTSVGWYARIIQRIKAKYPDAVIFCCGIPNTRNTLETRTQANEKISAICELLDCYFLDFQTYGVQPDNVSAWKAKYYKGGHLNVCGYKEFANMVMSYINWYIESNPQSFWKVPFVNLDLD